MKKEEFKSVIINIKNEIKNSQVKIMIEANKNLIMLYFRIGKIISENSSYGNKFIDNISKEIKLDFPYLKGFSTRNLKYMKKFYLEYNNDEIMQQLVAQLPWGHNLLLIEKFKDREMRKFYAEKTIENGWSRNFYQSKLILDTI